MAVRRLAIGLLVLLTATAAGAAGRDTAPSLRAMADRTTVTIGDRIRYTVEVRSKGNFDLDLPKFTKNAIGNFEIKDAGAATKKGLFGSRSWIRWFIVTTYETGVQTIPPVEVLYKPKGAKDWKTAKTLAIPITVKSVLPRDGSATDIKDIRGPILLASPRWPYVVGALVLGLIAAAIIRRFRRTVQRNVALTAYATAVAELDAAREALGHSGAIAEAYACISDCVRRYIEAVFALKAPEMTTEEFLSSAHDSNRLSDAQKALLKDFLEASDLVKFARHAPRTDEAEAAFARARNFIDQTRSLSDKKPAGE